MATQTLETPENVAAEATKTAKMNLSRLMLIGTAGPDETMSALVRLSGGKIIKVAVGDKLDGGHVRSVQTGQIALLRRGRLEVLTLPGS